MCVRTVSLKKKKKVLANVWLQQQCCWKAGRGGVGNRHYKRLVVANSCRLPVLRYFRTQSFIGASKWTIIIVFVWNTIARGMWYEFYIRQFVGVVSKLIGMHGKNKSSNNLFVSTKTYTYDWYVYDRNYNNIIVQRMSGIPTCFSSWKKCRSRQKTN